MTIEHEFRLAVAWPKSDEDQAVRCYCTVCGWKTLVDLSELDFEPNEANLHAFLMVQHDSL